jgi:hypothetical protein
VVTLAIVILSKLGREHGCSGWRSSAGRASDL